MPAPVKKPSRTPAQVKPHLYAETQVLFKRLEAKLQAPVISYWTSVNGSVCMSDVQALNIILRRFSHEKLIYLFIKSDGGNGRAALRIVNLLRSKADRLIALVPLDCESAATMMALGADEIQMGSLAFLTPVDTSITHDLSPVDKDNDRVRVGTNEVQRILSMWRSEHGDDQANAFVELYKYIHPLVIGAVDRAGSLSTMLCNEILSYHVADERRRQEISHALNSGYPSHGYPITLREAQRIGLQASQLPADIEAELMALNSLYSQFAQKFRNDYDKLNYHVNDVVNVVETIGARVYYEIDKDWHFRESDRTWISTNELSNWKQLLGTSTKVTSEVVHFR